MAAFSAFGQGAPTTVTELEEVVVTGSFIKTTPEDAAMPVEVITYEELQDLGRPSNLDLVKTMSETGAVAGETNRVNFYPMGAATVNLRSLGARFTTVVFNGRRFPEQFSVNTGRFNNISWLPNAAIGGVETLKAGGGATYGADAVAGVVNYKTRKGFEGLELNADYRYINDSDGDYSTDILWGSKYGRGDMLLSVAYQHRSTLKERDRPWAKYQYLENPASYSVNGNPGSLVFSVPTTAAGTNFGPIRPQNGTSTVPGFQTYGGELHAGAAGVMRDPSCSALGGFAGWSATPNPVCYTNTAEAEDLVTESETFQVYFENNHEFDFGLKTHTEVLLYKFAPTAALASTFGNNPGSWPLLGAPGTPNRGMQVVGGTASNAYFVPGHNPAAQLLISQMRNSDGTSVFTPTQLTELGRASNTQAIALQNLVWKPFGNGGNPYPEADIQKNDTRLWRVSETLSGNLPEFWGTSFEWEVGLTYTHVFDIRYVKDILVDRLQAALNGLGGPNCTGSTPGANGCQYFNPFTSAFDQNIYTGAQNPLFVGSGSFAGYMPGQGLRNDPNLVKWMYVPIFLERDYNHYLFDPIIRGDTGINLPGGTIKLAVGGQFRLQTEDTILDEYSNRAINPCPTLGLTRADCNTAAQIGPLALARPANVLGAAASNFLNEFRRYPVAAAFTEAQLPIFERLTVNIAGRYEKFFSDVTDRDNDVFIPAASLKFDAQDWLGIRASWGKTFTQVNPPRAAAPIPGLSAQSATFQIGGAGQQYTTANYPNLDIQPEKGTYLDFGFLIKAGNFTANLDYYDIKIHDYTRTMTVAQLLQASVLPGQTGSAALLNCSSSLLTTPVASLNNQPFVQLAPGVTCNQGSTTISSLIGGNVNFFGTTGQTNSGTLTTKGMDLSMSYRFDVGASTLTPSVDISRVLVWKLGDFVIAGVKVADGYDGLGFINNSTGRINNSVAEWRGTLGLAWRYDIHTVNVRASYIPGLINDSDTDFANNATRNANLGNTNGFTANGTTCTIVPAQPFTSNLGAVPVGAGSGSYGTGLVPTASGNVRGYCAAQNAPVLSGSTIDRNLNVDLVYRIQLPSDLGVTLTVNNLLDEKPPFYRGIVAYNTAYGSPLERNYKLGISKKF